MNIVSVKRKIEKISNLLKNKYILKINTMFMRNAG